MVRRITEMYSKKTNHLAVTWLYHLTLKEFHSFLGGVDYNS